MGEIEIDETLPSGEVGVLNRNVDIAAADIVDKDVDGLCLREHLLAKIFAYLGLPDVGVKGPHAALAVPYLGCSTGEGVWIARDKDDVGACLRGGDRDDLAETATAARDQEALAVEMKLIEHGHVAVRGLLPRLHIS